MKITMNWMKVRPSCCRFHTVTSFIENDIWQTRMYEKEIKLLDVSFIFHRKLVSRECVLRGSKCSKSISVGDGGQSHVPGCMAQVF